MQSNRTEDLRNIALMGHGGSGKTTLAEAALHASGAITRMGKVEDGNTVSDFDDQEHAHHYSISTSLIPVEWDGARLNLLDTPGFPDFEGEVVAAAAAADAALITIDAAAGIQGGTEAAWRHADAAGPLPRMIAITRLDREHTDYHRTLEALRAHFGLTLVPLAIPIGAAHDIAGVVDVITRRAVRGANDTPEDAPAELDTALTAARDMLLESVSETNDELMSDYLDGKPIDDARLADALHAAVARGEIVPVVPLAATNGIGVRELLDRLVSLLPSPAGREHTLGDGSAVTTDAAGPLVVEVFKTTADPFVGRLTYLKVLSGTLNGDAHVWNVQHNVEERLGHLSVPRGKEQLAVAKLVAGDIGVAAKLAVTSTGDTFVASEASPHAHTSNIPFPEATYRSARHPKTRADVDKLSQALARIAEQDPTIHVQRDLDTGETVVTTLGDAQIAIAAARLEKVYGVAVEVLPPRVPYRETISAPAKSEYRHKKQSGGHGQFAHVVIELHPVPRGIGVAFREQVVGGSVPKQFIPAVEKGIHETIPTGPLTHSPIVDIEVVLLDGSYHAVDSSEMAFKLDASQALRQGILLAHPVLLEPVMRLTIEAPADHVGDVMSDLNGRRGHVHGVDPHGAFSTIEAEAPLAEVQRYITDLRALTAGRGSFTMQPDHYAEVPMQVQKQVVKQLAPLEV